MQTISADLAEITKDLAEGDKSTRKRIKGVKKVAGLLPMTWWPKSPSTWSEVLHALAVTHVVGLRDVDASLGCACLQHGIGYMGLSLNTTHQKFMLNRLDRHCLHLMCSGDLDSFYAGEDAAAEIQRVFSLKDPTVKDDADQGEKSGSDSDSSSS